MLSAPNDPSLQNEDKLVGTDLLINRTNQWVQLQVLACTCSPVSVITFGWRPSHSILRAYCMGFYM